jgi:hypothetical protein
MKAKFNSPHIKCLPVLVFMNPDFSGCCSYHSRFLTNWIHPENFLVRTGSLSMVHGLKLNNTGLILNLNMIKFVPIYLQSSLNSTVLKNITLIALSTFKLLQKLILLALFLGSGFYRSRSCFQLDPESSKLCLFRIRPASSRIRNTEIFNFYLLTETVF